MTNILKLCNWVFSLFCRRSLSMKIDNQGDWGRTTYGERRLCADRSGTETTPQQAKSHQVYTDALLANLRKGKNVVEGGAIAVKNKVIVKDRDEWSSLADFIGNMIAKYADD